MDESKIIEELKKQKFENVISLGFFCSVAGDLEKLGLRGGSGPVDWMWSTWHGISYSIKTNFREFFLYENIEQSNADNCIYADRRNGIISFHDFSRYKSFDAQYKKVKEKYDRRIDKFYKSIEEPTLFIRYIWNGEYDGEYSNEVKKIEDDYEEFLEFIQSYNSNNQLIFIANEDVFSDCIPLFRVIRDDNDAVNRHPLMGNELLLKYLTQMEFDEREDNLRKYNKKIQRSNSVFYKAKSKLKQIFYKLFMKKYVYNKIYNHEVYKC